MFKIVGKIVLSFLYTLSSSMFLSQSKRGTFSGAFAKSTKKRNNSVVLDLVQGF